MNTTANHPEMKPEVDSSAGRKLKNVESNSQPVPNSDLAIGKPRRESGFITKIAFWLAAPFMALLLLPLVHVGLLMHLVAFLEGEEQ